MKIAVPVITDIRGFHIGQLVTLKNAAICARLEKKELVVPYKKFTDYLLVERINSVLSKSERALVRFTNIEKDEYLKNKILSLANVFLEKSGEVLNLPPLTGDGVVQIVFGKQFQADISTSLSTEQRITIAKEQRQTELEIKPGRYVTQEFVNALIPIILGPIDMLVLGANIIGGWATKALKLAAAQPMVSTPYRLFVHPVILLDGKKLGIWRETKDVIELIDDAGLAEHERPLFFSLLSLYYTTKTTTKTIKLSHNDITEVLKICKKFFNIVKWINKNYPYFFSISSVGDYRIIDLTQLEPFNFNKIRKIILDLSKKIDDYKFGRIKGEELAGYIINFSVVSSFLDYPILPKKTNLYSTGSELIHPSPVTTVASDMDTVLVVGTENSSSLPIKPGGPKKIDLKLLLMNDLSLCFNIKFASMILDSEVDELVKDHIRARINVLAPQSLSYYLLEGLFEAYLFERIIKNEIAGLSGSTVLPTDLLKKSPGLQRTIDYIRWYVRISRGIDIFSDTMLLAMYQHLLDERRYLLTTLTKEKFFSVLAKRQEILDKLWSFVGPSHDSDLIAFFAYISDLTKGAGRLADCPPDVCGIVSKYKRGQDYSQIYAIKFARDQAEAEILFKEIVTSKRITDFIKKEALKAFLQKLRLEMLMAGTNSTIQLGSQTEKILHSIDPIYADAALACSLPDDLDENVLLFYWNNLTHVSNLYRWGLPCKK